MCVYHLCIKLLYIISILSFIATILIEVIILEMTYFLVLVCDSNHKYDMPQFNGIDMFEQNNHIPFFVLTTIQIEVVFML